MEKDEYLLLYKKWSETEDIESSKQIILEIAKKSFNEIVEIEQMYRKYGVESYSPWNTQINDCVGLVDETTDVRIERMNSCEVVLSVKSRWNDEWNRIVLNVKFFGKRAKANMISQALEDKIMQYNSDIEDARDEIKRLTEDISDYEGKIGHCRSAIDELTKEHKSEGAHEHD